MCPPQKEKDEMSDLQHTAFETREEAEASYDRQIELLDAGDFGAWAEEIGLLSYSHYNHYDAWVDTGTFERSLFGNLPIPGAGAGYTSCASTIEQFAHHVPDTPAYVSAPPAAVTEMLERLLADAPIKALSDAIARLKRDAVHSDDPTARFSRAELEEFKRRQLLARFGEPR